MNKKTPIGFAAIFMLAFCIGVSVNPLIQHFDPKVNVYMEVIKGEASGASATLASGNLITDIGEGWIREMLVGNVTFATSEWAISLSNDATPLVTWTVLPNEIVSNGFDRNAGVVTQGLNGDYYFNVTYTFTATNTQQLQCAGLNWEDVDDQDNNLFAAATFTQTTFEASDTLTVTWIITINAN